MLGVIIDIFDYLGRVTFIIGAILGMTGSMGMAFMLAFAGIGFQVNGNLVDAALLSMLVGAFVIPFGLSCTAIACVLEG